MRNGLERLKPDLLQLCHFNFGRKYDDIQWTLCNIINQIDWPDPFFVVHLISSEYWFIEIYSRLINPSGRAP